MDFFNQTLSLTRPLVAAVLVGSLASLVSISCAQNKDQAEQATNDAKADDGIPTAGAPHANMKATEKESVKKQGADEQLSIADYNPEQFAGQKRLIEHFVNLHFEVASVASTRTKLLDLTKGRGFVEEANTGSDGKNFSTSGYIRYTAQIRSKELYQFLQDVGSIGQLQSETIRTKDHTAGFKKEQLKAQMLAERIARQNLLGQKAGQKNAVQAEQVLVQSEDSALNARYEKWRINDRVRWAQVVIYAHLPHSTGWDIPDYSAGFKGLLEGGLYFLYSLIYLVPISLLLFGGWQGLRYVRRKFS